MRIMGLRDFARAAWRQLTMPGLTFDSTPQPIDRIISLAFGNVAGARVTRTLALSVPAVARSRNLVCSIAALPLRQVDASLETVDSELFTQLDPEVSNVVTISQTVEDLYFEAISWWRIMAKDANGFPTAVRHLDVSSVSLTPPNDGKARNPLPSNVDPHEATVWVAGVETSARNVIRFDSPNPGMLDAGRSAIRRARFLDDMAEMYAKNPRPLDYFSPSEDADPIDDEEIAGVLADWNAARRAGSTAYIPAALKYNVVDVPTPADLQLLPQSDRATREIGNVAGLDTEDYGVSTTSRTYQNAIDRRQDRINDTLAPFMRAITDRLSMRDVTPPGHHVVFDLDDYLRADPLTRWQVYEIGLDNRVIDPEEVRAREGIPAGAPGPAPAAERADPAGNVRPLRRRIAASFDAAEHTFVDVPVRNFAVDVERRTIEGIVVPWGEVANKFYRKYEFAHGALQPPSELSRNKMLRDHMYSLPLGKMVFHELRADGHFARYRIGSGPDGDRALALASEGILDGLSVGVDFDDAADTIPHPTKKGVTLVRRADWRETSLTAMPSFESARVTRVAASDTNGGTSMECTTCGHVHAADAPHVVTPPTPGPAPAGQPTAVTYTADQVAAFLQAFVPGGPALPGAPAPAPQAQPVSPSVNPAPAAVVVEPSPYRFDRKGNLMRGSHDFSTDVIAASNGDRAAGDRANSWAHEQFVITTDVDELNPTIQRPDMYVDQRDFRYPVWNAIDKGTLTEITPFTFPKFNSAGTLVSAHVETTEPALGTFTATGQTVTPAGKSGKFKLSREVWDQGGNPQLSGLIWRQMTKAWFEALEAAAVAVLDAATPTAIALTAGGGTTGQTLDAELRAAFASLQFVRGGFTMDNLFTQIDLYKAVVGAEDDTGRALYPALGPANANGTVSSRFGAVDLNGVTAYPAWALAATGSVVASSYLFDSAVVHGWASAPQRIDINLTEVANVYIGLWGYVATAISDITGVREITYDPVP
jgi:HK97 family phage prohead protease